jgi:hypothetical protein
MKLKIKDYQQPYCSRKGSRKDVYSFGNSEGYNSVFSTGNRFF